MYIELTLVTEIKNVYVFEIVCWIYLEKEYAELSLSDLVLTQTYQQCNIKRIKFIELGPNSGC